MTARRSELRLAVALCLVGAGLVLLAVGQTWVAFEDAKQLSIQAVHVSVKGSVLVGGARALGYLGIAGVVALAATKRWGRVAVGLLVLAAGVGVVAQVAGALTSGLASRAIDRCAGTSACGALTEGVNVSSSTAWPVLALLGGVVLALSGALVCVRGPRWAALSSSYEAPAARAAAAPVTDKGVWDALDRGEDPT